MPEHSQHSWIQKFLHDLPPETEAMIKQRKARITPNLPLEMHYSGITNADLRDLAEDAFLAGADFGRENALTEFEDWWANRDKADWEPRS